MGKLKDSIQYLELQAVAPAITRDLVKQGVKNIDYDENRIFYNRDDGIQIAITFDLWNNKTGKPEKLIL